MRSTQGFQVPLRAISSDGFQNKSRPARGVLPLGSTVGLGETESESSARVRLLWLDD